LVERNKARHSSFFSAKDEETSHYNYFEDAIKAIKKSEKIPLSYFPGKRGGNDRIAGQNP
jgi:hypothetical protein